MLSDVLNKITNDTKLIERWKSLVSKDLKSFVKRTNPFRGLKISGFYFFVDTKSYTYRIILQGAKPNAGYARAFGAPVDKREMAETPRHILTDGGWKTVTTQRKTSTRLGVKALDVGYYGTSSQPQKFFGLKRNGKPMAFGLADETAVPIYSDTGLVEWITDDNAAELERILEDAGFKAIDGGL